MIKQMKKKLDSRKGFTLAELLVVIAILAILIAIAIPVFSNMVAEANLRVNQANVRSVRSAGVAHVLTHLEDEDPAGAQMNIGLGEGAGWLAVARVDNNGDIKDLTVFARTTISQFTSGISTDPITSNVNVLKAADAKYPLSDKVTSPFATVKPITESGGVKCYWVQAVITDLNTTE